jgi:hypothetical protein
MQSNFDEYISFESHDDLFELQKSAIIEDIKKAQIGHPRRAFLQSIFVAGLALGIGTSILSVKSKTVLGDEGDDELCLVLAKICGACKEGCLGCNQGCFASCYTGCFACHESCLGMCYQGCFGNIGCITNRNDE